MHAVGARTGPPPTVDHIRCRREIARVFRRVGIRRAFEGGVGLGLAGRRRSVARKWLCLTSTVFNFYTGQCAERVRKSALRH